MSDLNFDLYCGTQDEIQNINTGVPGNLILDKEKHNLYVIGNDNKAKFLNSTYPQLKTLIYPEGQGWYRIYTGTANGQGDDSVVFCLSKTYNSGQSEEYSFSISYGFSGDVCITQLSGVTGVIGGHFIKKIRVLWKDNTAYFIDFYTESTLGTTGNTYHVYGGTGLGEFQAPTFISDIEDGYTAYEFETVSGFKCSNNLTGNLNGNATTASSPESGGSFITTQNISSQHVAYADDAGSATSDGEGNNIFNTYLPKSGGTMTGALRVDAPIGNNSNYLIKPAADFRFSEGNAAPEGAITITLPEGIGPTMVSMWIDVYNYKTETSFSVHVGGYTYQTTWNNEPFAMVYGANHRVRLGHNGTNFVIYIGETDSKWSYPQISVRDVILAYGPDYSSWCKNWDISFSTSFSNVTYTSTNVAITSKNMDSYVMKRGTYKRIEGSSEDLNNYITPGFYNVKTQYVANCPSGIGKDAVLLVYGWDSSGYELQEITETGDSSSTRRWVRKNNAGIWGAWKEIISSENIGSYTEWDDVSNKPTFAAVATSGSYNDLSDIPEVVTDIYYKDGVLTMKMSTGYERPVRSISTRGITFFVEGTLYSTSETTTHWWHYRDDPLNPDIKVEDAGYVYKENPTRFLIYQDSKYVSESDEILSGYYYTTTQESPK